ncbi:MAG: gluconate 2-dehydrogenase subunit 3 family protein [Ferruginibacter sp.]
MDRRKSIKAIALGTLTAGALLDACKPAENEKPAVADAQKFDAAKFPLDRAKEELKRENELLAETFFTKEEMASLTILCDIIIPKDEVSGSASDAGVPDFIEFMVKDKPELQLPMRGGLRWMDMECLKRFNHSFTACTDEERIKLADDIAYPDKAKPAMKAGVKFFSLARNLTLSGFYTSKTGIEDLGYAGNKPNQWNGVPADILKQYGLAYSERELKECVNFDKP